MAAGKSLQTFHSIPLLQVLRTISGLCKNQIGRLDLKKAEEGFTFIVEALKKIAAVPSGDLLSIVKMKHELANLHLLSVDSRNNKVYDAKDRPATLAVEARQIVDRIIGKGHIGEASENYNYLRAKAIA